MKQITSVSYCLFANNLHLRHLNLGRFTSAFEWVEASAELSAQSTVVASGFALSVWLIHLPVATLTMPVTDSLTHLSSYERDTRSLPFLSRSTALQLSVHSSVAFHSANGQHRMPFVRFFFVQLFSFHMVFLFSHILCPLGYHVNWTSEKWTISFDFCHVFQFCLRIERLITFDLFLFSVELLL